MVHRWLRRNRGAFPSTEDGVHSISRESGSSLSDDSTQGERSRAVLHGDQQPPLDNKSERLAFAWWIARRQQKLDQHRNPTQAYDQEGQDRIPYDPEKETSPVDVDDGFFDVVTDGDSIDVNDAVSAVSIAQSENTPVISNRKFYSTNTYAASNHSRCGDGNNTVLDGIEEVPSHDTSDESGSQEGSRGAKACCDGFFDCRTPHGRMAFLLLLVFCVAVVALTGSLVLGLGDKTIPEGSEASKDASTFVEPPIDFSFPTPAPIYNTKKTAPPISISATSSIATTTTIPLVVLEEDSLPTTSSTAPTSAVPTGVPTSSPTFSLSNISIKQATTVVGTTDEAFGQSVALSDDGSVMVVGAPQASVGELIRAGRVVIYHKVDDSWQVVDEIGSTVAQNALGSAIAVSSDGRRLAVSEPTDGSGGQNAGRVQVYEFDNAKYTPMGKPLLGSNAMAYFGVSVALDGNRLAVGAPYQSQAPFRFQGQVSVYEWDGMDWNTIGRVVGGADLDWLGSDVDLHGDILISSAPRNDENSGYVRAWQYLGANSWAVLGDDMVNDVYPSSSNNRFGDSISLSVDAAKRIRVAVGIPWKTIGRSRNAGMVVVYELSTDEKWVRIGDPIQSDKTEANEEVGAAVSLNGALLAVGIPGASGGTGAVGLYRFEGKAWEIYEGLDFVGQQAGADFGVAVSLSRSNPSDPLNIAVGAVAVNTGLPGSVNLYRQYSEPPSRTAKAQKKKSSHYNRK